ncbi:LysR family transcriptional regulator [Bacterioplanoides sp.]|uniref:LysR family transcriptional regulator n=1 Tax=Bacterioplanoides sp. TaxID=2066072 RepID=UPI003B5B5391
MIYNDLALFTTVAKHLSFSEAAKQTGIPLSRVSRRVQELEQHLGVKLLERSTRRVRLTEEGRRLLDRCQDPVEVLQEIAGFAEDTKHQTIHITAPALAARKTIGPHLLHYLKDNPNISVKLTTSYSNLDFFRDNIDFAFRVGPLDDSNLVARKLWDVEYCFCASQDFIKAHKIKGKVPLPTFIELPAIVSRQPWLLQGNENTKHGEKLKLSNIVHEIDEPELIRDAAALGLGIAMLPKDMMAAEGGKPALVEIKLKQAEVLSREMYAVYPSKRLLPARVRNLIEFMAGKNPHG